jgi:hypothetical protein
MEVVTIFENVKAIDKPYLIPIDKVVQRIKAGRSKIIIDQLRNCKDEKERKNIKTKLPSICFSGKFSRREDKSLIEHSGLIAIDFDHVNERLSELKNRLIKDKYTFMLFISPSGDGLKLVVKIPANAKTHSFSAAALTDYYKDEKLDEFKDVSRICFESYDPEIFYNPESDVFKILKEEQTVKRSITTNEIIYDYDIIISNIEKWLESKGEYYQDGNKHKFLVKIFAACNRFGVPLSTAKQLITFKYVSAAGKVEPKDFHFIADKIYKNYSHSACTAHFDKEGTPIETISKKVLTYESIDISLPLTDVIYLDNVRESMLLSFKTGQSRGETTHFPLIDEHFRWKRGELTLMHGIMNQGKSTMIMQLCLMKAVFCGHKFAFFSPEQDPPDDFYDDLIHMYLGENTQKHFHNQVPESEYIRGMDFIKDHFFYIYPENESPTPEYINARFVEVIKKHTVDGCIIDPYNQLDNDIRKNGGREDLYLSAFLSQQKRLAQIHKIFMVIVTHPKGNLSKNGNGDYEKPDIYDLSGGAMWSNKCDNVLCTYRPYYSSDKDRRDVQFSSQKIKKRKLCGTPGDVELIFKSTTMRYYEMAGQNETLNPLDPKPGIQPFKNFYEKEDRLDFIDEKPPF